MMIDMTGDEEAIRGRIKRESVRFVQLCRACPTAITAGNNGTR